MEVRIKRVDATLPLPEYHSKGAVGFDMYSRVEAEIKPKEYSALPANIVVETPQGYMLALIARSSLFRKKGLIVVNSVGVFDPDFRGDSDEMIIQLYNLSDSVVRVERGERIVQGIFMPVGVAQWNEVESMENQNRGGIGSTG